MSLTLLTLLCVRPVHAQIMGGGSDEGSGGSGGSGGGSGGNTPDPGHYWKIDCAVISGSTSYGVLDIPYDGLFSPQSGTYSNGGGPVGEGNINGSITGTIKTTLTWVPALGQTLQSDPPSEPVFIKEHSMAEESPSIWNGSGSAPAPSGSADDGLNDPSESCGLGYMSTGTHLIKRDGSTGTITLDPVTLIAITPVSQWLSYTYYTNHYYWDWTGELCETSFTVSIDADPNPRAVMIISSIDPTYHKDPVSGKQPNLPDPYGSVYADSVNRVANINNSLAAAFGGPTITYIPQILGSWDPNSSYNWYSAITGKSDAGTFAPPNFPVDYPDLVSSREHINLKCVDAAADGATATANYYVNWHNEWEGLTLDAPNTEVIDSDTKVTLPDGTDYPAQENRSTAQMMTIGPLTVTSTATAALSTQFSGTFKISDLLTLGGNFQPSLSLAVQAGQTVSGPQIPPLSYVLLYFHVHYHRNRWLTDHYNQSGFDQTYTQVVDGDEKYISLHWGQAQTLGNVGGP